MKELLLQSLVIIYGITGIIGIVAYLPTIKDLFKGKASANVMSYLIWTTTAGIGFLYSLFILSDNLLRIVLGLNFLSCLIVLILRIKIKK